MNMAVMLSFWLLAATPEPLPLGTGHQLLCGEFNAGQVIAQSTGHRLQATAAWAAGKPISRSGGHFLLQGCAAAHFRAQVFDALFEDRYET